MYTEYGNEIHRLEKINKNIERDIRDIKTHQLSNPNYEIDRYKQLQTITEKMDSAIELLRDIQREQKSEFELLLDDVETDIQAMEKIEQERILRHKKIKGSRG